MWIDPFMARCVFRASLTLTPQHVCQQKPKASTCYVSCPRKKAIINPKTVLLDHTDRYWRPVEEFQQTETACIKILTVSHMWDHIQPVWHTSANQPITKRHEITQKALTNPQTYSLACRVSLLSIQPFSDYRFFGQTADKINSFYWLHITSYCQVTLNHLNLQNN